MRRPLSPLFLSLGFLGACLVAAGPEPVKPGPQRADMDTRVKPCEDFYQYANGTWLKNNPIPAEESIWGGFNEVRDRTRDQVKAILDEATKGKAAKPGSVAQKVSDFYTSAMDEATIERVGMSPLKPVLARIEGLKEGKGLPALLASLHNQGLGGGFGFFVMQDQKESTRYLASLSQGGLGLPDRDYYTKTDTKSVALREAYRAHVEASFVLAGESAALAKAHAGIVLDLETQLAKASLTRVEQRDPQRTYNKMDLKGLEQTAPGFDWKAYFAARGVKNLQEMNVRQPGFFKAFGEISAKLPAAQWRTYFRWHAIRSLSEHLSKPFSDASFSFYEKQLTGVQQQPARWKRMQGAVNGALGEAVGQIYVEKHFTPEAKAKVKAMVENLRTALKERILGLDWMSEPTKQAALKKLAAFGVKVGYPDAWRDYSKLQIRKGDHAGNVMRARAFEIQRNLAKLGKPIDRGEWGMSPQTVNAYYSPTMNEIVFPAAILQAPFFDVKADDAVNYGGIGMVIGHEMTHGFDDSGSQYDAEGNLKNWWTAEDKKAYQGRTDLIVQQYDAYKALPDQNVNGKLTLGENIADLGGLKIAFEALKMQWAKTGKPAAIDGFSGEQRFFLNLAVIWRNNIREEALRVRLNTDPHSPGKFRVLGPLSNLPEFAEAFGCQTGEPMARPVAQRPTIW